MVSPIKRCIHCSVLGLSLTFFDTCHVGQVTLHFHLSGKKITCPITGQVGLSRYSSSYRFSRTFHQLPHHETALEIQMSFLLRFVFLLQYRTSFCSFLFWNYETEFQQWHLESFLWFEWLLNRTMKQQLSLVT